MRRVESLSHTQWECKYHIIARTYLGRKRNYVGQHFWVRGYFASAVGRDEQVIREYILRQEAKDRRIDQLQLM
ncbi:MAG: transposase [Candidatus Thiodiazotropha sp.]|jgi:putative transposase